MTAGEGVKKAAEGAKNVTDRVVDAVEAKINQATDAVEDAVHRGGAKVHEAASQSDATKS